MFIRIVKFKDGKYAVRKWTFIGYQFLDIEDGHYWWLSSEGERGTLKQAEEALEKWKDRNGKSLKR
ncbi:hypothetical protein HX096_12785 [Empedobacter falsenii]|uniref:hypothetical protein n=1 Tax=Empedobacter falsenii TaxID=343874 RepID=UPI002574C133|nr:hypothetical protein [Empedobacter falsenii]MDM1548729.1 hypothetical protein [Empedobacter falsenii]